MNHVDDLRGLLLLARNALTAGERAALARGASRGDLVRIARGAYVRADRHRELEPTDRHRLLILATCPRGAVVSHGSAAILHGLPWIGPLPDRVHLTAAAESGGRSTAVLVRHAGDLMAVEQIDGMTVTSLARTVVDVARTARLDTAVAMADAALAGAPARPPIPRAALLEQAERVPVRHGSAKARFVARFSSPLAGSPGESVSRLTLHRAGFPPPVLQHPFPRQGGGHWFVDFWWPDHEVIGEFDGRSKYLDPRYLGGRSTSQAVYDEKLREDELRALGPRLARWDWAVGSSVGKLTARLSAAGLPLRSARGSATGAGE